MIQIIRYNLIFLICIIFQPLLNKHYFIFFSLISLFLYKKLNQIQKKQFNIVIFLILIGHLPSTNHIMRNIIFNIIFIFMILFYSMTGSILILFSKYFYTLTLNKLPKILATHLLFMCNHILNIKVKVQGKLPKNAIIIPQHQSVLEIIILCAYLKKPTFIFKESFLYIPFLGYCMKNLNMIPVNRSAYNPNWMNLAINNLNNGYNVIIFSEGRRVNYGESTPYKKGAFSLAKATNRQIIPVYINSGLFWPKNAFFKKAGTTLLIFGKKIDPNPKLLKKSLNNIKDKQ